MRFQVLDALGALAAQHVADLFDSDCACECPRCCLACRAVKSLLDEGLDFHYRLERMGIEGHLWQDSRGGFDETMIGTRWHSPCPVYEEIEAHAGDSVEEALPAFQERG